MSKKVYKLGDLTLVVDDTETYVALMGCRIAPTGEYPNAEELTHWHHKPSAKEIDEAKQEWVATHRYLQTYSMVRYEPKQKKRS